jgi:hypothetical protein
MKAYPAVEIKVHAFFTSALDGDECLTTNCFVVAFSD